MKPITVPFYGQQVFLIEHGGKPYVAMRPIVENVGLNWKSQYTKIKNRFDSVVVEITTTGKDDKQYKMLCLPLEKLTAWLFTIQPNKVKPAIRKALVRYQEESEQALFDYWTTGTARRAEIRERMAEVEQREALSFERGSFAGRGLNMRKLEKRRNALEIQSLQQLLPFVFEVRP